MSAPARLLALRMQGFKSFAERTVVEFGGGISAVVGPNGSGKSNLADALRWSLGEQGRALRSRKSEDVIFAGSDRRAALGMADVTLVLDNSDALLPVDFSVLELGRRLYRSGENDYLLNKQRVRLRDLVDLLDAAHLADNAFLFIGQGMVDQALALRPEERRPLFEEVAGVRRHERRRRRAEEQLAESETNLARVEDIVAELRPQARRLAVQAEQQTTRTTAAEDLADALIVAAHGRWHEAAGRARSSTVARDRARGETDAAMAALAAAEERVAGVAADLGERADAETKLRQAHDLARTRLSELQLRHARLAADLEGIVRDRARLDEERTAAAADFATQRRLLSEPVPGRDLELEAGLAEAERALAGALEELGGLRAAHRAQGEEAAAVRRAEAARQSEAETARRRLVEAERRHAAEIEAAATAATRRDEVQASAAAAAEALRATIDDERLAAERREAARATLDDAEAARQSALERSAAAGSLLATQRGRLEALEARIADEEARGIARAAKRRGGRRVDEQLDVEPTLRAAIEAALDESARAYVVDRSAVAELTGERGTLVLDGAVAPPAPTITAAAERSFLDTVSAAGGVRLVDAVRRDPTGAATRLLRRAVAISDIGTAVELQPRIPPGWLVVTRDGSAVVTDSTVRLGRSEPVLERHAEAERLRAELMRLMEAAGEATEAADATAGEANAARRALDDARAVEARAGAERRTAEEAERSTARALESVVREATWHEAQAASLDSEVERLRQTAEAFDAPSTADMPQSDGSTDGAAIAAWESRAAELRAARDRRAAELAAIDGRRRDAEARRARAEAAAAMDEERISRAERDATLLAAREAATIVERESLASELAIAARREEAAAADLATLRSADSAAREGLAAAEREASAARERLRTADDRLRAAERADLEARLGRDSLREQLLVELAALGGLGLARLRAAGVGGPSSTDRAGTADALSADDEHVDLEDQDAAALETALSAAIDRWAARPPDVEAPSAGRIATLRRRYHELGAANPFAVDEYAAVKARLESLESQEADLRRAIDQTRSLIGELTSMIADQFRATFRALETAFDARFQQLFGGGYAKLVLTDPNDLSGSGIEIVARPPGKKQQALAMLSGGERALTAVALLFAMLEVRPVPFCVLDEVDAALDEANVGRFTAALRDLAARTQFIVITHNRGTIEAADALYGVTVGDDSVSRVISLRLDEARAIADRQRDGTLAEVS